MENVNYAPGKRYYTFDFAMKQRFGGKVVKIPLDGGFTCPHIDGTKGFGGCVFCSQTPLPGRGRTLREQYEALRPIYEQKWGRDGQPLRIIPYFQTFSGTYAPLARLQGLYEEALALPGTVGISIATRADCITPESAAYLRRLASQTYLTVELGLQTARDDTAARMHRCMTTAEFLRGAAMLDGVPLCIHLINGLPGETKEDMLASARLAASLRPREIKLHMLYVEEGTALAKLYRAGEVPLLTREEYTDIVTDQLTLLPPDTIIGRLTGDGDGSKLLAPLWTRRKREVLNGIDQMMEKKNTRQGAGCGGT